MKKYCFTILMLLGVWNISAQLLPELNYPLLQYRVNRWPAKWVTCADIAEADYAMVMFRRSFSLPAKPEQFVVHVSADNRYKLYVNGILSAIGPQGSDWRHWRYETIDIAPYLQAGDNVIAAEVANWGPDRYFGIMSIRTAFMMQGATQTEAVVNTTADGAWKAKKNEAYKPITVNWIYAVDIVGGLYATNPGDSITVAQYPHNWTSTTFDDSAWKQARWIWNISNEDESGFFWLMKPRTTPQVAQTRQPFGKIVRSEGLSIPAGFVKGESPLVIPAQSKASILFDYGTVTLGFPELLLSGGKNSIITLRYAENLYNPDRTRGDRNVIEGKQMIGIRDVILPDGREQFRFSPTWYRAFRFVQMDIETAAEPLVVHDYFHMATMSPVNRRAVFECNDPVYLKIDEICWRTAAICTQDNLMSDAYYEQMMYVGDSWVHALINLYMTGDDIWMRNAIEQFDYSRMPDGNITSCYPLKSTFVHPTYSLAWIDMLYDYMMHCDDRDFIRKYVQSIRSTLAWFDNNLLDNGLVGKPVGSYFIDWYNEPPYYSGEPPGSQNGNSAVVSLYYAATLLHAAALFEYLDLPGEATVFRNKAEKMKADVIAACWDDERGLFAENPDKKFYDERTNIMAIVAQVFDEAKQKALLTRCLDDTTISKPSYYFIANHFNEMRRLSEGAQIDKVMNIWKDLIAMNMTTTPERTGGRQRSEAHPWSGAPAIAFIKVVAGIAPACPGYKSVSIEPALGKLNYVKASYPHYLGDIKVELKKAGNNGIEGSIELPKGLNGVFRFNDQIVGLKEGVQKIKL